MKVLKHRRIDKEFAFDETTNYCLCIENPKFFREFIHCIDSNPDEQEDLLLYDQNKQRKISKEVFFIHDPRRITLDEKKLNLTIQKDLASSVDAQENERFLLLRNEINEYLDSISYDYPLRLTYDSELGLSSFLKAFSVSYESNNEDLLVEMIEKIKILSSIFNYQVFIIRNLADYLTQEELNQFFQEMRRMEVAVLLLSSHLPNYDFDDKFVVRIDSDLCELHLASENQKG